MRFTGLRARLLRVLELAVERVGEDEAYEWVLGDRGAVSVEITVL